MYPSCKRILFQEVRCFGHVSSYFSHIVYKYSFLGQGNSESEFKGDSSLKML